MSERLARVEELHRRRPRRPLVTRSLVIMLLMVVVSWLAGDFQPTRLLSPQQRTNAVRFLGELQPWPLQQAEAPAEIGARLQVAGTWAVQMWRG